MGLSASLLSWCAFGVLAVLCVTGAWLDITSRRLPNWLCALTAVSGLAASWMVLGLQPMGSAALHGLIALIVGMILFRLGMIGGGDAKFYAGAACWFPLANAAYLLGYSSIVGFFMALFWIFKGNRKGGMTRHQKARERHVPYGVAIATGALIAAFMGRM